MVYDLNYGARALLRAVIPNNVSSLVSQLSIMQQKLTSYIMVKQYYQSKMNNE